MFPPRPSVNPRQSASIGETSLGCHPRCRHASVGAQAPAFTGETVSGEKGRPRAAPHASNRSRSPGGPRRRLDGRHQAHERRCRFLPAPVGRGSGRSAAGSTNVHRARRVPIARSRLMLRPSSSDPQADQRRPTAWPQGQAHRPQQAPSMLSLVHLLSQWGIYPIGVADSTSAGRSGSRAPLAGGRCLGSAQLHGECPGAGRQPNNERRAPTPYAYVVCRQRRAGTADTCPLALPPLAAFSHR